MSKCTTAEEAVPLLKLSVGTDKLCGLVRTLLNQQRSDRIRVLGFWRLCS
jgi:hypothetical protein